jgi:hypothetical protein
VVYPALARVDGEHWPAAHEAHGRAIAPLVGVVYLALVAAGTWAALVQPSLWVRVSVAGALLAGLTTAFVAAPTHGALGRGRSDTLVHRLLVADRVRSLGAVVCLAAAVLALAA